MQNTTEKSKTCTSKKTGQPVAQFKTKTEALKSAEYTKKNYKTDLIPYKCEKCGFYHLAPKDSVLNVKQNACSCRDSNGKPKALYLTKADAEKQRKKSQKEQNIKLRVYKCEDGKGFHLTHTEKK